MKVDVWCKTDVGLKRETNQDSYLIDRDLGLFIVADGMGGHKGGEVASQMAAQTVREVIANSFEKEKGVYPRELLMRAFKEASTKVFQEAQRRPELKGMGTTMVVMLVRDGIIYIANVGDSRAYLMTSGGYWQLTEDHSLVNEQIRAGLLTPENAKYFGAKNVITRSVGFEAEAIPDVLERKLYKGERYLVCSDGLSGLVEDEDIAEVLSNWANDQAVNELVHRAKENGGDDNVTVLLLKVLEGEELAHA